MNKKYKFLTCFLVLVFNCGQDVVYENDCITEGNTFSGKAVTIKKCCPNLVSEVPASFIPENERDPNLMFTNRYKCKYESPLGLKVCIKCGDNICSEYENPCTCPNDCPEY